MKARRSGNVRRVTCTSCKKRFRSPKTASWITPKVYEDYDETVEEKQKDGSRKTITTRKRRVTQHGLRETKFTLCRRCAVGTPEERTT